MKLHALPFKAGYTLEVILSSQVAAAEQMHLGTLGCSLSLFSMHMHGHGPNGGRPHCKLLVSAQWKGRWAARGCALEEENEADHKEEQNNDDLQEEGCQNSVLIIGVGVCIWAGLQPKSTPNLSSAVASSTVMLCPR